MMNEERMDAVFGEDEPILPDGWQEGDDIFADAGNDIDRFVADGFEETNELPAENEDGNSDDAGLTMTEDTEEEIQSDAGVETEVSPDGDEPAEVKPARKLKLKVNHQEEEINIDEMSDSDLTALLQKGRAFDAMKESENKQKYRDIYHKQLENGMTEELAHVAAQSVLGKSYPLVDEQEPVKEVVAEKPKTEVDFDTNSGRDFMTEVKQLKALFPEFTETPDEVAKAVAKGVPLFNAYLAYRDRQRDKTAASLKKENEVLKQNAASAARAPVRGVTGGGNTAPKKVDSFIKGFDSDNW